jgi:hypothetical protein
MKMQFRIGSTAALCAALAAGACQREAAPPEAQSMAVEQKAVPEPTEATGCLRAGMAANTFVLMSGGAQPGQGEESATYQLTGHDVDLRSYVGQEVKVSGLVRAESEVASNSAPVEEKAKGTAGTPTVETASELTVKQMTVDSVSPTGGRCAPALPSDEQPERRIK